MKKLVVYFSATGTTKAAAQRLAKEHNADLYEITPEQVIADVSWTNRHPIKQVYMTCNCNTGQKMWDPLCVIQAVEGDALFSLSERGTINITPQALTIFTPSATGNIRYQLPGNAQWATMMLEKIRTMNKYQ